MFCTCFLSISKILGFYIEIFFPSVEAPYLKHAHDCWKGFILWEQNTLHLQPPLPPNILNTSQKAEMLLPSYILPPEFAIWSQWALCSNVRCFWKDHINGRLLCLELTIHPRKKNNIIPLVSAKATLTNLSKAKSSVFYQGEWVCFKKTKSLGKNENSAQNDA